MTDRITIDLNEPGAATPEMIRAFVVNLAEADEEVKEARDALKKATLEDDEIERIDNEIKALKEERKEYILSHPVLSALTTALTEAQDDKKQLIADAKSDRIPESEIGFAIKMLKKDADPEVTTEVYANISDLVS